MSRTKHGSRHVAWTEGPNDGVDVVDKAMCKVPSDGMVEAVEPVATEVQLSAMGGMNERRTERLDRLQDR